MEGQITTSKYEWLLTIIEEEILKPPPSQIVRRGLEILMCIRFGYRIFLQRKGHSYRHHRYLWLVPTCSLLRARINKRSITFFWPIFGHNSTSGHYRQLSQIYRQFLSLRCQDVANFFSQKSLDTRIEITNGTNSSDSQHIGYFWNNVFHLLVHRLFTRINMLIHTS